jgi:hypothetical protein
MTTDNVFIIDVGTIGAKDVYRRLSNLKTTVGIVDCGMYIHHNEYTMIQLRTVLTLSQLEKWGDEYKHPSHGYGVDVSVICSEATSVSICV